MNTFFLGLGSNIGNKQQYLTLARQELCHIAVLQKSSSLWKSAAWGNIEQEEFFNAVVQMCTDETPHKFLKHIHQIEGKLGRVRRDHWGPRTIDIDILFWNEDTIQKPDLQIPHRYAHKRAFVLLPLLEITPQFTFPNGTSAKRYMQQLSVEEIAGVEIVETFS